MSLPDYQKVFELYQGCSAALEYALHEGEAAQLAQRLQNKSEQLHPVIMVYGVYNAGKSTLLNALMGRADAEMADRPMTDSVTPYRWRGYTLYDTPGIDAPLAHQSVTEQQLKDADVVLFVVAAGGAMEEQSTWQTLTSLVAKERRVMLIVNNKIGLKPDSRDYLHIVDNLRQRLQQAADDEHIEDIVSKVSIQLVNARSALKGRLENKPLLVEISGLLQLEQQLGEFLQQTDSHSILHTCYHDLNDAVTRAQLNLSKQSHSSAETALAEARTLVEGERTRLGMVLNEQLARSVLKSKRSLALELDELLENCRTQQQFEEGCNHSIERASGQILAAQQALLESELPKSQRKLMDIGEALQQTELRRVEANPGLNSGPLAEEESSIWKQGMQQVLGHSNKLNVQSLAQSGAQKGLEIGKDLLPGLFKGIGKKTIERWAATAGRYAGPAVSAAVGIWGIYQAVAENDKVKQAKLRRRQAADDNAATLTEGLKQAWQGAIREMLSDIFLPLDELLAARQQSLTTQSEAEAGYQQQLQQVLVALRDTH